MTLEELYYVSQIVSVVAIVGSLLVLIFQMRQANRMARQAATREQVESVQRMSQTLAETPGLADVFVRGNMDLVQLSKEERMRYVQLRIAFWRTWEGLHAQHRDRQVDEDVWNAHLVQLRNANRGSSSRTVWAQSRQMFTPAFQAFFDVQLADSRSDTQHDLTSPSALSARSQDPADQ